MSNDTIKITEEDKEALDEIKENYYEYTTLSYTEAIRVLIAEYNDEGDTTNAEKESPDKRGDASQEDEESFRDEDVPGGDELTAEERVNKIRVDE